MRTTRVCVLGLLWRSVIPNQSSRAQGFSPPITYTTPHTDCTTKHTANSGNNFLQSVRLQTLAFIGRHHVRPHRLEKDLIPYNALTHRLERSCFNTFVNSRVTVSCINCCLWVHHKRIIVHSMRKALDTKSRIFLSSDIENSSKYIALALTEYTSPVYSMGVAQQASCIHYIGCATKFLALDFKIKVMLTSHHTMPTYESHIGDSSQYI